MERRQFIDSAIAVSACSLAGLGGAGNMDNQSKDKKYAYTITVLKRTFQKDYADKYRGGKGTICGKFKDGQVFTITDPWTKPDGFCDWAWADLRPYIHLVCTDRFGTFVSCCTDGFRPVFFKIEGTEC